MKATPRRWVARAARRVYAWAGGYTELAAQSQYARLTGLSAEASLAFQACVTIWAAGFRGLTVTGDRLGLLTPDLLAGVGASFATRGEWLALIDLDARRGRRRLIPAASWTVTGRDDPAAWRYRLDLPGPSSWRGVEVGRAGVVHAITCRDPRRPWAGEPPAAELWRKLEDALNVEMDFPTTRLLTNLDDMDQAEVDEFRDSLEDHGAGVAVLPTPPSRASGYGVQPTPSVLRYNPSPDERVLELRATVREELAAALGVTPDLVRASAPGNAQRESFRRWAALHLAPAADLFAAELSERLGFSVRLSVRKLAAGDLTGRARALRSLTAAGVALPRALDLVGLE